METPIPFSSYALNAVDKKGRVSLPAEMRSTIEERARLAEKHGLQSNPNLLLIRKDPSVPCLLGVDQTDHFRMAQLMEQAESEAFVPGSDPWARGNDGRFFGTFERTAFDKAGRMVLNARLRDRVEIGEHAFFLGTRRGIEIWNPKNAHSQYTAEGALDVVDIIEYLCAEKDIAL